MPGSPIPSHPIPPTSRGSSSPIAPRCRSGTPAFGRAPCPQHPEGLCAAASTAQEDAGREKLTPVLPRGSLPGQGTQRGNVPAASRPRGCHSRHEGFNHLGCLARLRRGLQECWAKTTLRADAFTYRDAKTFTGGSDPLGAKGPHAPCAHGQ